MRLAVIPAMCAVAMMLPLAGCAQEPRADWEPAESAPTGATLMSAPGSVDDGPPVEGDEPSGVDPEQFGHAVASRGGAPVDALGLVAGRIRNDTVSLAARFLYIPGVPQFNERINAMLRREIAATGKSYTPEVHATEAGLEDRGCIAGSASWDAADVLTRAETGPDGGVGTAITCEVTAAHGSTLAVVLRTVVGNAESIGRDESTMLVVDVEHGTVEEAAGRWSEEAPAELWLDAAEALRRRLGGLSAAPIAPPDAAQRELAARALDAAVNVSGGDGAIDVTMPVGFTAPELEGLGFDPEHSEVPLVFRVDADTAHAWASATQRAVAEGAGVPFVGLPARRVPIDCGLIPCVALTYDDGPSGYTGRLLDTLEETATRATFFMIGTSAAHSTDTVRRVRAEGHDIGSHTMSHPDLTLLTPNRMRAEVYNAAKIIEQASGRPVPFYRPPYGGVNAEVLDAVELPAILWSVDTNDWQDPGPAALLERGSEWARPGDIILFHDTHEESVDAAPAIIAALRARGFEPVTVTELFGGRVPEGRVSSL